MTETNFNLKHLYTIGRIAALTRLAAILASIVIAAALGARPASAEEFFYHPAKQRSGSLAGRRGLSHRLHAVDWAGRLRVC